MALTNSLIPTLYLTRTGLLEPLGQSQVMAYLRGLSRDYQVTLITYEKDRDWADTSRMEAARRECESYGIHWLPQRFRFRPRIIAPTIDMIRMARLVAGSVKQKKIKLIHARSYIPAAVALFVKKTLGVPFIFDMRALWPEELIAAGRLKRNSIMHWFIKRAERACLEKAAAVVSLTHSAVEHLKEIYPKTRGQRFSVIPTCADLDRFTPADETPENRTFGCLGTVLSGWFRIDWLASFFNLASNKDPELSFELTTLDDPEKVRAALGPELQKRVTIESSFPDQVQNILRRQIASVMFFTQGLSKLGSSPTRMGEILGCGIPVVANDGVGDVAKIIKDYRVGVVIRKPEEMANAWDELQLLLSEPDLATRCRNAAEDIFSLKAGTDSYRALYTVILGNRGSVPPSNT
ncbi:D-inositol-3-phosphate glycosyltransferase [Pigmentiphaga humi]|uniref:D-inositol-3-phosphate glycosyltransferase n=1 Tax=Pigmentiphaga humi TaxID=2478468 RepID=A0A3P4B1F0_9BURK|nr:glycosyltransferase [Pigmentiphaga humi]VCU70109.1 D-inositol-3-phosphate glycosyltransferase [Pigmentiphaga humi]